VDLRKDFVFTLTILTLVLAAAVTAAAGDGVLPIQGVERPVKTASDSNPVFHRCLTPHPGDYIDLGLQREHPWSLPKQALDANAIDTIHVLVGRFNFQYETIDDPNTTGRGIMNLARPRDDSVSEAAYYDSVGHWVDPPPHDSAYFDVLMFALSRYYEVVSDGKITLTWDIYPKQPDSVYQLPHEMAYYGKCNFADVVQGLENYFIDAIQVMDTTSPEIHFADYQSIFLFHAGSDRQNDIGFPETCNDLFTGYISFFDSVAVDTATHYIRNALMMPETACQDNRATALNAVMAHEFGHQLGLVDLYDTRNFMSQLGDFALMDNNGFGTAIDFGFAVGRVFGAIPIFPCAWSRAHLGFVDVHDFRKGTDIEIAAAEMESDGIRVARIPISEKEYYLLENRVEEYDGILTGMWQDSLTDVFRGPVQYFIIGTDTIRGDLTREYDFLAPGSGMLIYHVDEAVAGLDYNNDGDNNFDDNQLQWDPNRRFITVVEGDGIVDFGGYYRRGYGSPDDMYRDDRNTSLTPNTNPPAIDNSGNNTHIRITGISRVMDTAGAIINIHDTLMRFDVETEGLVDSFPVRAGSPVYPLSPIADDLNRDGTDEIIFASGRYLSAVTTGGESYLGKFYNSPIVQMDSAFASINPGKPYPVPLALRTPQPIQAGPVTGDFGNSGVNKYVAVGFPSNAVWVVQATDNGPDGQMDFVTNGTVLTNGTPIALTFGDQLFILTDRGNIQYKHDLTTAAVGLLAQLPNETYHGICRVGPGLLLLAGDSLGTTGAMETRFYTVLPDSTVDSLVVDGYFSFGPISVDVDRDGTPEIVAASPDGDIILVSVDIGAVPMSLSFLRARATGIDVTTNPVAADMDADGYPDLVFGGVNQILAVDRNLTLLPNFPKEVDDGYPGQDVTAAPVVADIQRGGLPEVIFPTEWGNIYAIGNENAYGFPLSAGEIGAGSPVTVHDSLGGMLGFLGADGWFYLWQTDVDTTRNYWPMGGADPSGSLVFDAAKLGSVQQFTDAFDEAKFFNYPNPVDNGQTTIRYFLGQDARRVDIRIYDLSGREIAAFDGPTAGGVNNEKVWDCADITPGVYRCRLEVEFDNDTKTAFKDIAIIR